MKGRVELLDCTLRDGGFVNDWEFGFGSIRSIISRLDCAGIDTIEIGFINERRGYDENRTIFPDTKSIAPIFDNFNKPRATIVGMIDYGTCSLDRVQEQSESCLDGIRVIFKKKDQDGALDFLAKLKSKGYKVFVNPVSITSYSDEEVRTLAEKINGIKPNTVSVVDTYGLMHSSDLLHYFGLYHELLSKDIILGYHAHNNFQMAYANSISLMVNDFDRRIMIDGSLFGMGKSAGNACTELLAMYMNEHCGRSFDLYQIQEAIDINIMKEYDKKRWGYGFEYFIAALNDCHPSYVEHCLRKKSLSIRSVNEILQRIPAIKKLSYDEVLAETLYHDYQNAECDDTASLEALKNAFERRKILLLGPGKTIQDDASAIQAFISRERPVVVSVNFLNESFPIDYVFMSNAKRYSQFFQKIYGMSSTVKTICTSNITDAGEAIDYMVNYPRLLADEESIRDNPLILFVHLLVKLGILDAWLAGFDGYAPSGSGNYYDAYAPYLYCHENVLLRNEAIKKELASLDGQIRLRSITRTMYGVVLEGGTDV